MTSREVEKFLNRSASAIRMYIRAEGLPVQRIHGRLVFDREAVEAWRKRPEVAALFTVGDVVKNGRFCKAM